MARSVNQCNFIGNLTRDIELRYAPSGSAIASGTIACNYSYKNKQSGEKVEEVEFINLTFFGRLSEIAAEYLKKGSKIYVSGRMKTDKYEKEGITRYSTKIIVNDLQMLDSREAGSSPNTQQQERPMDSASKGAPAPNDFDDDIPF